MQRLDGVAGLAEERAAVRGMVAVPAAIYRDQIRSDQTHADRTDTKSDEQTHQLRLLCRARAQSGALTSAQAWCGLLAPWWRPVRRAGRVKLDAASLSLQLRARSLLLNATDTGSRASRNAALGATFASHTPTQGDAPRPSRSVDLQSDGADKTRGIVKPSEEREHGKLMTLGDG